MKGIIMPSPSGNSNLTLSPRPYSAALMRDMARVEAHYLLRVLRESGGLFRDLAATQTPWRGMIAANCSCDDFLARAESLLIGAANSLSAGERVERFLEYADPFFAAGPMVMGDELTRYRWFGCFRFGSHPEIGAISIHIRNNCMPHSPFENLSACARSLSAICEAAEAEPFPVESVTCGTWLNDLPVFLGLFPPSYRASLEVSPPDSKGGWGWWGQLVDRTGQLHAKRAATVLETGRFPHPRKEGRCGFQEFKRHVSAERRN